VSSHDDRLHAEIDRQLTEVRAAFDGLTARAGLLIAAGGVGAAIVASRIQAGRHESLLIVTAIAFGVATVAGAVTLMPWLRTGPVAIYLVRWLGQSSPRTTSLLYDSKIAILTSNMNRLLVMKVFFALQAVATITAVGLALWYSAWK
jgi:hypothetical protein